MNLIEKIKSQNLAVLMLTGTGAFVLVAVLALLSFGGPGNEALAEEDAVEEFEEVNSESISLMFGLEETDAERQAALEAELNELDPPHAHNPINPATQRPFSNRDMERFEQLRSVFPKNRMIPIRRTPVEKEAFLSEEAKRAKKYYESVRVKILTGGLSQDEIDEYFNYRTRNTRDKIRLFQYALDNLPENAPESKRKRLAALLEENEGKMARAQGQKEAAYAKSEITATASIW